LCCVGATAAVVASIAGLRSGVARGWAATGLALGLVFGVPFALSQPEMVGAFAIPTAAVVFVGTQWR
jgi:hypothetical protein